MLYGEGDSDTLTGDGGYLASRSHGGNDRLFGGADNDRLAGDGGMGARALGGADLLHGGVGNDSLEGDGSISGYAAGGGGDLLFGETGDLFALDEGLCDATIGDDGSSAAPMPTCCRAAPAMMSSPATVILP